MLERVIKLVFNSELLHLLSKILMWFDVTGALGVSESAEKPVQASHLLAANTAAQHL